jgi:cyclopropane-fatty-acyl-phospholipid synthase
MAFPSPRRWPILGRRDLTCDQAEALVRRLFGRTAPASFGVQLWDGRRVEVGPAPQVTFSFADAEAFRRCLGSGDPAEFAETYTDGRLRVDGDLEAAARVAFGLRAIDPGLGGTLAVVSTLGVPGSSHSAEDDERDVRAHYDLSNAFFELFLDTRLVYSCAYFATPGQSLEQAQARKLDLICRKLALAPGDHFLDIGCGWGGLLIWAASRYGVRAHGLTLSVNQHDEAVRRLEAAGLQDRVTVQRAHYQTLPAGSYDAVASVGMYEHVGLKRLSDYCRAVYRTLRPGGLFMNHGITLPAGPPGRTGGSFIFRRIFPGAELAPLATIQAALEEAGFEILDVQSLRAHYALTLAAWLQRFERRRDEAVRLSTERTVRMWEVYLAGCAEAFREGLVSIHQVLARRPGGRREPPLTRKAWEVDLAS